jgi:V8-like Glu-specific endopeptidase
MCKAEAARGTIAVAACMVTRAGLGHRRPLHWGINPGSALAGARLPVSRSSIGVRDCMDILGQVAAAAARYQNADEPSEQVKFAELKARAEHLIETTPVSVITTHHGQPAQRQYFQRVIDSAQQDMPVAILRRGLEVSRNVARISSMRNDQKFVATGFLVSPDLLLTAAHVLPDMDTARTGVALFDFEMRLDGSLTMVSEFTLNPDRIFVTNEALDYTLVAVSSGRDGAPGHTYGWCRLVSDIGKVVAGEQVQIVGHPLGEPKRVSLGKEVVHVLDDFLQYVSGFSPGGSGAPVFNMQWELVGMHHAKFEMHQAKLKEPSSSYAGDSLFLGEATLVSAIVQSLGAADIAGADGDLLTDMLAGGDG